MSCCGFEAGRVFEKKKFYQVNPLRTTDLLSEIGRFHCGNSFCFRLRMWCMISRRQQESCAARRAIHHEEEPVEQAAPCNRERFNRVSRRLRDGTGSRAARCRTRARFRTGPRCRTGAGAATGDAGVCSGPGACCRAQAMRCHGDFPERRGFPVHEAGAHRGGQDAS